jgi:insertion element IS1 protein InsB
MNESTSSCFRCVGGKKICNVCDGAIVKHGIMKSGKQRYKCKNCNKTQVDYYTYQAYQPKINKAIVQLNNEGVGIRSISRILKISATTLLRRILIIADSIPNPPIVNNKTYEVDEMRTFVKKKSRLIWIVYALERSTKSVVSFNVGARTNRTLNVVLKTLQFSEAKRIYTDKLPSYKILISKPIHRTAIRGTNHIERKNLTLRTHLKRLNRRTICFSRSVAILTACLRIYFWG